jgi:hypothetical protein
MTPNKNFLKSVLQGKLFGERGPGRRRMSRLKKPEDMVFKNNHRDV